MIGAWGGIWIVKMGINRAPVRVCGVQVVSILRLYLVACRRTAGNNALN